MVCRYSAEQGLWVVDGQTKLTLDIRIRHSATVCIALFFKAFPRHSSHSAEKLKRDFTFYLRL